MMGRAGIKKGEASVLANASISQAAIDYGNLFHYFA